jgi:hypothetical protein
LTKSPWAWTGALASNISQAATSASMVRNPPDLTRAIGEQTNQFLLQWFHMVIAPT